MSAGGVDVLTVLQQARDKAQTEYANAKRLYGHGLKTAAQLDKARAAYWVAQDEYRAALTREARRHG